MTMSFFFDQKMNRHLTMYGMNCYEKDIYYVKKTIKILGQLTDFLYIYKTKLKSYEKPIKLQIRCNI